MKSLVLLGLLAFLGGPQKLQADQAPAALGPCHAAAFGLDIGDIRQQISFKARCISKNTDICFFRLRDTVSFSGRIAGIEANYPIQARESDPKAGYLFTFFNVSEVFQLQLYPDFSNFSYQRKTESDWFWSKSQTVSCSPVMENAIFDQMPHLLHETNLPNGQTVTPGSVVSVAGKPGYYEIRTIIRNLGKIYLSDATVPQLRSTHQFRKESQDIKRNREWNYGFFLDISQFKIALLDTDTILKGMRPLTPQDVETRRPFMCTSLNSEPPGELLERLVFNRGFFSAFAQKQEYDLKPSSKGLAGEFIAKDKQMKVHIQVANLEQDVFYLIEGSITSSEKTRPVKDLCWPNVRAQPRPIEN